MTLSLIRPSILSIFFLSFSAKLRNFTVTLVMLDREYYSHYEDLTNFVTRGLIEDLTNIFEPFFKRNFPGFLEITFRAFSQGGRLGVTFDLSNKGASVVNESIIMQALQRGNGTRELRYEFLDFITVTEKQSPVVAQVSTLTGLYRVSRFLACLSINIFKDTSRRPSSKKKFLDKRNKDRGDHFLFSYLVITTNSCVALTPALFFIFRVILRFFPISVLRTFGSSPLARRFPPRPLSTGFLPPLTSD